MMMKLKGLILYLILMLAAFGQISYDIVHSNMTIDFENSAGGQFSNTVPMTNLTVTELALDRFMLRTNGTNLTAGQDFVLNLQGVDFRGYHVTITSLTNISLQVYDSNFASAPTNLSNVTAAFISASAVLPDFYGVDTTNAYPLPGYVYLGHAGYPITSNNLGLLSFMPPVAGGVIVWDRTNYTGWGTTAVVSLTDADRNQNFGAVESVQVRVQSTVAGWTNLTLFETGINTGVFTNQIALTASSGGGSLMVSNNSVMTAEYADTQPASWTNTNAAAFKRIVQLIVRDPWFVSPGTLTNVPILGFDDTMSTTNDISAFFAYTALTPSVISSISSNQVQALSPGRGTLQAVNLYDSSLATNVIFLVTVPPSTNAGLAWGSAQLDIPNAAFGEELYLDVRTPQEWDQFRPLLSNNTAAVAQADADLTASEGRLASRIVQISAINSNLIETNTTALNAMTLTFTYSDSDLVLADGRRMTGADLKVYQLDTTGPTAVWVLVNGFTVNESTHTVTVSVTNLGVYTLGSLAAKTASDLDRAAVLPNPADFSKGGTIHFINLPANVTELSVYRMNGRLVKQFTADNADFSMMSLGGMPAFGCAWDGSDDNGEKVQSGLYLVRISTDKETKLLKVGIKAER